MVDAVDGAADVVPDVGAREARVAGFVNGAVAFEEGGEGLGGREGLEVEGDGAEDVDVEGVG